ncbi:Uncharacterized protein BP5553_09753 [Venustampulla echinocandica]|uniref:Uncharacterized protein n=1 Tax=Venustampulla echinocandica TaxID=2656787 RepID=A0A370TBX0_9HELO|nr:Uncharacterized protein BP5553_09753 [Venustampulla echinocandica]RDL31544.1 Uncharacterized protein BP5553_09753 [Venustampulla echinocandica]
MPNIKYRASPPNEDGLYAALAKMEATDAASIYILRKRSQHEPLRNIISGLWFAILYRAVEHHTPSAKVMRKNSRRLAIHDLTACLRDGNEISSHNENISKMISKRMRSGLASWTMISQGPGLLAIVNVSNPPSKKELRNFLSDLPDDDKHHSNRYRTVIQRILGFIEKTLRRTQSLYRYVEKALRDVIDLVNCETYRGDDDVEEADIQHPRYPNSYIWFDSSCNGYSISLEASFNKSTYPRYIVQYDSPIFICVQSGDIHGAQALFQGEKASIYDVDPYNLGLLYYASYYCWRCNGAGSAIRMCRMLIQMGADMSMIDEVGNAPIHTMTDSALVERCRHLGSAALIDVGRLYNMSSQELVEEHRSSSKLTTLHETLLNINPEYTSLPEHLQSLQRLGTLAELIDKPDSRGRSALAWAVEYGMANSVQALLSFGANCCQYRKSSQSQFPLLHLVIAGPPPPLTSGFLEVVKILLATEIDINARDDEGWSAWHVAASWRSYDILRLIMRTHGTCVKLDLRTNNGASAHDLSQDADFYGRLLPNWRSRY